MSSDLCLQRSPFVSATIGYIYHRQLNPDPLSPARLDNYSRPGWLGVKNQVTIPLLRQRKTGQLSVSFWNYDAKQKTNKNCGRGQKTTS